MPDFDPCPTCGQYSYSLGTDAIAAAFNHFQSMQWNEVKGYPTQFMFGDATRDAAQVLMARVRELEAQ